MKKILFLTGFLPVLAMAQNIGIGTIAPAGKLQINHNSDASPHLRLIDSSANSSGIIRFMNLNNTTGMYIGSFKASNFNSDQFLYIASDSTGVAYFRGNGNIGIRNAFPNFPLDIQGTTNFNAPVRVQGLNLFEFGAGVAGKEVNAGKIGYNAFGQNALTIVGGGTTVPNRAVYFFAEGGTTMNGPLGFNGPLRINGNPGITGQVLTSNGTGTVQWSNAAYANNVRFAASFTSVVSATFDNTYTSIYNTGGADVSITTNTITINKTGLYHFEGYYTGVVTFTTAPSFFKFRCSLFADGIEFKYSDGEDMVRTSSSILQFSKTFNFSQDVYITAPAIIYPEGIISTGSGGSGESRSGAGKITGYLISE